MAYISQLKVNNTTYDIKATADGNGNTIASTYLKLSGGTVNGLSRATFGFDSWMCNSGGGTAGYFRFARLVVTANYVNSGMILSQTQRGAAGGIITLWFNNANNVDPDLNVQYLQLGGDSVIYYHKAATSTWDLYIKKEENYGSRVFSWINPGQLRRGGITWTWVDETVAALPSGYSTATRTPIYGAVWN